MTISHFFDHQIKMSHPIQRFSDVLFDSESERFHSAFDLANRRMNNIFQNDLGTSGISSLMNLDPNAKVFGSSSVNVVQISHGSDNHPHIVQAHHERRIGPGGVWQTKKAFRDPDHGIDRMQVGYFVGDQGEIFEREFDPTSGQYRQDIKRRGIASNERNFSNYWRQRAYQAMERLHRLPSQSLPLSSYGQYPQQALPSTSSYPYY